MRNIKVLKTNTEKSGFSGYIAKWQPASKHGAVILLGGESVMLPFLKPGRAMAKQFAAHGLTAVSVSLFGAAGLPVSPDRIPLEYALNAVKYLRDVENCTRITVFGMSMGSIVALGTAIHSDAVDDLIMMSPSHVAFEAVSKDKKKTLGRSFLTYEGHDIPYVSADFSRYAMYVAYEKAYSDKQREAASMAALPVTAVRSRILLMAGEKDSSWPSAYSVRMLYDLLERSGTGYPYKKVLYPGYGHLLPLRKDAMLEVYDWIKDN